MCLRNMAAVQLTVLCASFLLVRAVGGHSSIQLQADIDVPCRFVFVPAPVHSHFGIAQSIMQELLKRGHLIQASFALVLDHHAGSSCTPARMAF